MNYHRYFSRAKRSVEACVLGAGAFGRSLINHAPRVPLLNVRVAVDISAERAADAFRAAGIEERRIRICTNRQEAASAWSDACFVAADDFDHVVALPFDIMIEATGHPEAGARHAAMALDAGRHLAIVSKELDSVVGPYLAHAAARQGRVSTPVDGDQPGLLIGLITWAETLGFQIVAAGKSSEYDFVFDPRTGIVDVNGVNAQVPELSDHWSRGARDAIELAAARARLLDRFPTSAVADLCELSVVANATGFGVDRPSLHAPIARITDVADLLCEKGDGGLLDGPRRLDIFNCLRAPEDVSFAGGVFIVVRCDDPEAWSMLAAKGHLVSRNGRNALLYQPRHLLGLEAAISVLDAVINGVSSGGLACRPHLDLIGRALVDLPAGARLTMGGHHHTIEGVAAELAPAAPLGAEHPVPFYLAANRTLRRSVSAGSKICLDDVDLDERSVLLRLRRLQDAQFHQGALASVASA